MRGYYVFFGSTSSGVKKKINTQVRALNKVYETVLINVNLNNRNILNKIKSRLPWESWGFDYDSVKKQIKNPDFLYIRRTIVDKDFLNFLKYIKKNYKECKILIEIYTYPYDIDDFRRNFKHFLVHLPFYVKDVYYRKNLKFYVDRFITFSKDEYIFGIETIKSVNGIDIETIKEKKYIKHEGKKINLLSVAHMQEHHGYERLIEGIKEYYDNKGDWEIKYYIVGDGKELIKYKKLVKKYNLQKQVIICGKKFGEDLEELYNIADIGVSSLGLYKYNINYISSIKTSEYLAKGLPVLSGCEVCTLGDLECNEYICEFPNDSSSINIDKLILFYKSLYESQNRNIISEIRSFACEYFNMDYALQDVIKYIGG